LVCPSCGTPHDHSERFCRDCGLPLVLGDQHEEEPLSEARERARKVLPRYSQGPLVRVGTARHQAEAEMLEGLLLEEGIPSLVRRSGGFDVPDFLAAGPRDILVPESGAELAREILGTSVPQPEVALRGAGYGTPAWVKALAVALAVGILALIAAGVFAAVF
jgi:Putative prokaryotic signal transducing protein